MTLNKTLEIYDAFLLEGNGTPETKESHNEIRIKVKHSQNNPNLGFLTTYIVVHNTESYLEGIGKYSSSSEKIKFNDLEKKVLIKLTKLVFEKFSRSNVNHYQNLFWNTYYQNLKNYLRESYPYEKELWETPQDTIKSIRDEIIFVKGYLDKILSKLDTTTK